MNLSLFNVIYFLNRKRNLSKFMTIKKYYYIKSNI